MMLLSFDLNSTCVRAVGGLAGEFPLTLQLEPPRSDFPMVLSWTGRSFDVGSQGLLICRERPFLICRDFLPFLGEKTGIAYRWQLGKHQLDSTQALKLVFQQLRQVSLSSRGLTFALPPYLQAHQIQVIYSLAQQLRYPLFGSINNPLAMGLAAFAEHVWSGTAAVIDLDDHALWLSVLQEADGQARICQTQVFPHLGLKYWKNRLLNSLADCCIAASRRDPRESAAAEQSLYLQLDGIMENCTQNRPSPVAFQTSNWYQQMVLQPAAIADFCMPLVRQVISEVAGLFNSSHAFDSPGVVLLSYQATALPGLAASLQQFLERWAYFNRRETTVSTATETEDFGENLFLQEAPEKHPRLILLSPDAAARGAHLMAGFFQSGYLEQSHFEESAPLPEPQPVEAGPARLHFQGRDYFLRERAFTIGRRYDCDLVFDAEQFPEISPWHCEIIYDPRKYLIKNLSREGTWVNNQPLTQMVPLNAGDWIRLGLDGPQLRFLGQPNFRSLTTIA